MNTEAVFYGLGVFFIFLGVFIGLSETKGKITVLVPLMLIVLGTAGLVKQLQTESFDGRLFIIPTGFALLGAFTQLFVRAFSVKAHNVVRWSVLLIVTAVLAGPALSPILSINYHDFLYGKKTLKGASKDYSYVVDRVIACVQDVTFPGIPEDNTLWDACRQKFFASKLPQDYWVMNYFDSAQDVSLGLEMNPLMGGVYYPDEDLARYRFGISQINVHVWHGVVDIYGTVNTVDYLTEYMDVPTWAVYYPNGECALVWEISETICSYSHEDKEKWERLTLPELILADYDEVFVSWDFKKVYYQYDPK